MDRMELLKLALASTKDPREALAFAREMAAFVTEPVEQAAPVVVAQSDVAVSPSYKKKWGAKNERRRWTTEEKEKAAALLDNGASYGEVARVLGRSPRAVQDARSDGHLPVKKHTLNPLMQLSGVIGATNRGFAVQPETIAGLFNGSGKQ